LQLSTSQAEANFMNNTDSLQDKSLKPSLPESQETEMSLEEALRTNSLEASKRVLKEARRVYLEREAQRAAAQKAP
jgi:hypothetical protein